LKKLDKTSLREICDTDDFDFDTTADITELTTILGQDRLTSSMEFGMDMDRDGYNIFALGPNETDKRSHIEHFIGSNTDHASTPEDLCYVNNFDNHYKPNVLKLPAGRGSDLKEMMDNLIEELPHTLNSAFETEEYRNRQQALQEEIQQQQDQTFEDLQNKARDRGLALMRTPAGFSFAPINEEGELMSEEDVKDLPEEKREELQEKSKQLQKELQELIQKMPSNKRKMREKKKELDQEVATFAIKDLFENIRNEFSELDDVQNFLDEVEMDVIDNVQGILNNHGQQEQNQLAKMMGQQKMQRPNSSGNPILDRYRVNVIVDNSETDGAPIIYEDNPSYKNLTGRVEYQSKMGALTTNFNMIKSGALHRANGGYLILDARQVLLEPFAWEGLKRTLKSGKLKIESLNDSYSLISTVSLEPDPIDINVKVVLLGQRMTYYLLCKFDPDFQKLFKVEADFEDEIDRSDENHRKYVQFLAGLIEENDLRHFDKHAVAKIIEQSSRMVEDTEKLSTKTEEVKDLLVESNHWAKKNEHDYVQREDVEKAITQKIYRSARLRDKVQESINRDYIYIDTEGETVGQVNGLAVMKIGNLMFGRPNRITARVQLGKGDIINIERKVDMSGPIHSKGVLILKGYIGEQYAKDRPLSMSASLVFEQSYSLIDGDSASAAELFALLSAIGEIPLKQSFSVTGSVNQHGKIQPIGGVNEKIEGFYDICEERGLTGEQGVLIPKSNEKNLMLRNDILDAVAEDKFSIYSIETIEEGMELLTGLDMGVADKDGQYPEGTINYHVSRQLDQLAKTRKDFASIEKEQ